MEPGLTQQQLGDEFLKILVLRLQRKMMKLKVGSSNELYNSFDTNSILGSSGDLRRLDISFLERGRFVDMGVGKGVSIADVKENARPVNRMRSQHPRRPKKWYSKTIAAETKKLAELLSEYFGVEGINRIESFGTDITIMM